MLLVAYDLALIDLCLPSTRQPSILSHRLLVRLVPVLDPFKLSQEVLVGQVAISTCLLLAGVRVAY